MRPNPCFKGPIEDLWKLFFGRLPVVAANVIPHWRRDVASHQRRLKTQLPEDNVGRGQRLQLRRQKVMKKNQSYINLV